MAITHGTTGANEISIEGRITRADGTVVELGVIAYWHRNPFKRLAWRVRRAATNLRRKFGFHPKGIPHDR